MRKAGIIFIILAVVILIFQFSGGGDETKWRFAEFRTNNTSQVFAVLEGQIPSASVIGISSFQKRGASDWEVLTNSSFVVLPEPPYRIGLGILPATNEPLRIVWFFQKMSGGDRVSAFFNKLRGNKTRRYSGVTRFITNDVPARAGSVASAPPSQP